MTSAVLTRIAPVAAVLAAVWFSAGDTRGALVGSALLGAVLVADRVRAAAAAGRRDALEEWLAVVLGRLGEYAVYAGLAVGGALAGEDEAWAWAAGALIALALRDSVLEGEGRRAAPVPPAAGVPAPREGSPLARLPGMETVPERTDPGLADELLGPRRAQEPRRAAPVRRPAAVGALREAAAFPRPLRFAVIAVGALAADARVTFIALMVGCAIAVTAALADPRPERGPVG
ncbi:hypothetical protein [Nocardiopsis suaedae]|uniref:Transferase n=1 Tax=Nocardiopsis suaedae TaxID=3018444 RepID=A0ABT4TL93_9ACTN|nr:hypothetical protein [Nocardiopsis suaedae]MDA2805469.1 hypothetical protein [Nocardiopsis suaedae]